MSDTPILWEALLLLSFWLIGLFLSQDVENTTARAAAAQLANNCPTEINYIGEFNRDNLKSFEDALSILPNTCSPNVYVTSGGGDSVVAIDFVNLTKAKNSRIILRDYCLSACAIILALTPNGVTKEANTFIGFHNSNASMWEMLRSQLPSEANQLYREKARKEINYYKQNKIDQRYLYFPHSAQRVKCYQLVYKDSKLIDTPYFTDFILISVSESLSLNPLSTIEIMEESEFSQAVRRLVSAENQNKIALISNVRKNSAETKSGLHNIPRCKTE
jgi:hypothetical protein